MFFHSDPTDNTAPPDAEVFKVPEQAEWTKTWIPGWYFWFIEIPDTSIEDADVIRDDVVYGPYRSQAEAIEACREMVNE